MQYITNWFQKIFIFKYAKENNLILKVRTPQLYENELKQTVIFSSLEITPGGSITKMQEQDKNWSKEEKSSMLKVQNYNYTSYTITYLLICIIFPVY